MKLKASRQYLQFLVVILLVIVSTPTVAQIDQDNYTPFKFSIEYVAQESSKMDLDHDFAEIIVLQKNLTSADKQAIKYWNGAYPNYRWHQILMQISRENKGHNNGGRVVILHLAIYDAIVKVWELKERTATKPPFLENSKIRKMGRSRDYSSFVCEWSAAAGAAREIIAYYYPERSKYVNSLLERFVTARLRTGLQTRSDIEHGLVIGKEIATKYTEYARTDRTDKIWTGTIPDIDTLWTGTPSKYGPVKRQWKPLTLSSPDQFRPAPPPTDWSADMEELRQFNANNQTSEIAWKWKSEPIFDNTLERKIMEYDLEPLNAAYASALFHTARFDAIIAAWDGKYHYMGIRPFQYDPTFKPILVETPNFPGYPAGHTTVAGSLSTALSYLFPQDSEMFEYMAWECSESRFEGGAHFRTDNEVGLEVGANVAQNVIKAFK